MAASSEMLSFADPFPFQAGIRAADLELFLTAKGEFRAELTKICLNQLWMQQSTKACRGSVSGQLVQAAG